MVETVVVGAGIVGLSTAWYLQEHGIDVVVVERRSVAAGSSWGNAGWLSPGKTTPLADPSLWAYGFRALIDPDAALQVPFRFDRKLWSFLARFMGHATHGAWEQAMAALAPMNRMALECFDKLTDGGVQSWTRESPWVIGFTDQKSSQVFLQHLDGVVRYGLEVPIERLENPRDLMPILSDRVSTAYRLEGQRFTEPAAFTQAIANAVEARGGQVVTGVGVRSIEDAAGPVVVLDNGQRIRAGTVVIASGAWLPELARPFGVRVPLRAGRGYSFTVGTDEAVRHPVYLPQQRIACTPYRGRLRVAGTMEFRGPDEPFEPRRITAMTNQLGRLFTGVDLDDRQDEWVGSRPVTADGLPVLGRTASPRVHVAGGHGMWGMVLGPVSGKLVAEQIATGRNSPALTAFDPLRSGTRSVRGRGRRPPGPA